MPDTAITGASRNLGRLSVDQSQIRGEGGPINPTIVMPLVIELEPLPDEQRIVATEIRADLTLGAGTAMPGTQLGATSRAGAIGGAGHLWANYATGSVKHHTELRFALTQPQMSVLETLPADQAGIPFFAKFEVKGAWLREEHGMNESPIGMPVLDLWPILQMSPAELTLVVGRSDWADAILPGLGASGLRLVALRLPVRGQLPDDVVTWYDEARLRLDRGDYRGAIERARDIRHSVETLLNANQTNPIGVRVAEMQGVPADSSAMRFLSGIWKALVDATNSAHHPEGPGPRVRAHEARAVLLVTATALEYLQSVLAEAS